MRFEILSLLLSRRMWSLGYHGGGATHCYKLLPGQQLLLRDFRFLGGVRRRADWPCTSAEWVIIPAERDRWSNADDHDTDRDGC